MSNNKKKFKNLRKQFLIDKKTQYRIASRLVLFWLVGGLIVAGLPLMVMFGYGTMVAMQPFDVVAAQVVDAMWFPMVMSIIVIPAGIWYSIRFSNRIAGPIFRIRRELDRLNAGEESFAVTLRKNDFFKDLADSFNLLRQRVLLLEDAQQLKSPRDSAPTQPASSTEKTVSDASPLPVVDAFGGQDNSNANA